MWAQYESDTLELSTVNNMVAAAPAIVHQVECVEIQVNEWSACDDWPVFEGSIYGRIEQEEVKWVAVVDTASDTKVFSTFLDVGFDYGWGSSKRKLYDDGRYQLQADGSYKITDGKGLGAGVYDVTIGKNTFCCLRVLEPDLSVSEGGELVEAYIERGGRTVFFRRYDGRFYRDKNADLTEKYPNNAKIIIDGCVYVHCDCTGRAHDTITNTGLGIDDINT